MKREEIERFVKIFGVNPKCKGFEYFVELVYLVVQDYNAGKIKIKNYNIKKYFNIIAEKYDARTVTIPSNIRNAVTTSNLYGNGLTPTNIIDNLLCKIERERKREK